MLQQLLTLLTFTGSPSTSRAVHVRIMQGTASMPLTRLSRCLFCESTSALMSLVTCMAGEQRFSSHDHQPQCRES